MTAEQSGAGTSRAHKWIKFIVGPCAGFLGLKLTVGNGAICTMLVENRWPNADFGGAVIAVNDCEGGSVWFFSLAVLAGYLSCGYLAEKKNRPFLSVIIGLAAGALAASVAAFVRFNDLYGWAYVIVQLAALWFVLRAIYTSRRRWLSLAYAILAFVFFLAIGTGVLFVLDRGSHASFSTTNAALGALTWIFLIPSALAANVPPRRKQHI